MKRLLKSIFKQFKQDVVPEQKPVTGQEVALEKKTTSKDCLQKLANKFADGRIPRDGVYVEFATENPWRIVWPD